MKNTLKFSMLILCVGLAAGCASNSDVKNLQKQLDSLKSQVSRNSSDIVAANASADAAHAAASEAAVKAAAAETAANRAADYAEDTNRKLNRMFDKAMMK